MSTFVRLTLIGLSNHRTDLFDKLSLPAEYDRQTFIDTLLLDHGEKRVVYPEPDFMKYAIGVWSRKWEKSLERIAMALNDDYNPLHNYDRREIWTEHEAGDYRNQVDTRGTDTEHRTGNEMVENTGTVEDAKTGTVTTRDTGTVETDKTGTVTTAQTGTSTETTNNMTTERTVSAFNESGYQPDEKSVTNGSITRTPNTLETVTHNTTDTLTQDTTETVTHNTTETETHNRNQETDTTSDAETNRTNEERGRGDDRRERNRTGHAYGNIGVTTSQQMAEAEIDLRRNNNMYAVAAELFADDLLLMLY